jgi:hypothetical protein
MSKELKIFRDQFVDKLYSDVKTDGVVGPYRASEVPGYSPNVFLTSDIVVPDDLPVLGTEAIDDLESAIAIYEYIGPLTSTQASDRRLWTYLSHVTFREYTQQRWEVGTDDAKAKNSILNHWFVSDTDRSLRRHSVARLWWAAHLTVAPWEKEPNNFLSLKNDDRYVYTRALLSKQDIFQQILERSMGRSKRILMAFLEIFRKNPGIAESRERMRNLIKEANLMLGYRKLPYLPYSKVHEVLTGLASET